MSTVPRIAHFQFYSRSSIYEKTFTKKEIKIAFNSIVDLPHLRDTRDKVWFFFLSIL